jgi:hypothetical protein
VQLSAAAGRWAQSAELVASVDQTLLTTQDRESAANAAGDQSAAKLQDGLIPKLEQRERTALASMASAGRAFGDLLQTHGIGYRMNVAQSRAIINAVEKKLADQHITASELKQLAPSELTPRPIDILRVLLEG